MSNVNQTYNGFLQGSKIGQLIRQFDGKTLNSTGQVVASNTAADGKLNQAELAAALLSVDTQNPNDNFYTPLLAGLLFGNANGGTMMQQADINGDGALNEAEMLHITTADADLGTASQTDFENQFGTGFNVDKVDEAYNSADFKDRLVELAGNTPPTGGTGSTDSSGILGIFRNLLNLIITMLGLIGGGSNNGNNNALSLR